MEDAEQGFVWVVVNENDTIENYKEGQEGCHLGGGGWSTITGFRQGIKY